jgi:hypothetical protein
MIVPHNHATILKNSAAHDEKEETLLFAKMLADYLPLQNHAHHILVFNKVAEMCQK